MGTSDKLTASRTDEALRGDPVAVREVVAALTPVIQTRVARVLLRHAGTAARRDIGQEVEDLTQDILLILFEKDGRVLRGWDPERGLSLANFVGLVAERRTVSRLRALRTSPWSEDPTDIHNLELPSDEEAGPEVTTATRELLQALADQLRAELSPLGMHMFWQLFVEQRSVQEVCAELQMQPDAVYAWRSRLGRRVRRVANELLSDSQPLPRTPDGEAP